MPRTLGMRHVALYVNDPQVSKKFYTEFLEMSIEWEPDPENVYLTSQSQDNVALHKAPQGHSPQGGFLDHIGFILPDMKSVDEWYKKAAQFHVKIAKEIKTHRDGARSFYFEDPDGIIIQMIYHPPIADSI